MNRSNICFLFVTTRTTTTRKIANNQIVAYYTSVTYLNIVATVVFSILSRRFCNIIYYICCCCYCWDPEPLLTVILSLLVLISKYIIEMSLFFHIIFVISGEKRDRKRDREKHHYIIYNYWRFSWFRSLSPTFSGT